MLFIKQDWQPEANWHVGETLPIITARVVTFQADGDELEVILAALKATVKTAQSFDFNPNLEKE